MCVCVCVCVCVYEGYSINNMTFLRYIDLHCHQEIFFVLFFNIIPISLKHIFPSKNKLSYFFHKEIFELNF